MFNIPKWSMVDNPLFYRNIKSTKLLITVGDSWTYGDSLGNTRVRNGQDDLDYRINHIYGGLIANVLQSDWINLALPGISNSEVINWLDQLLLTVFNYHQITCIITLTESGRHIEMNWQDQNLNSLQHNLECILDKTYIQIAQIQKKYPNIKFIIAHNFTDARPSNLFICSKTWLEVMLDQLIQNETHIVVSEHIKQLNYNYTYPDTLNVIDRAMERVKLLDLCIHCCKEDTRHPTETGHKIWANYLITQI